MASEYAFSIHPQPDDRTCGPTCLHAVYLHYGDEIPLERVVTEVPQLPTGGTLGVMLACHALRRGYRATLLTYNLEVFDPTWFGEGAPPVEERLRAQRKAKASRKLREASRAYLEFLELGGELAMQDLSPSLLSRPLARGVPLLTGLSSTFLYRAKRETPEGTDDDVRGIPMGHFVVLVGYDARRREVLLADPYLPNPMARGHLYTQPIARVITSILLGVLTYDANVLLIEPAATRRPRGAAA